MKLISKRAAALTLAAAMAAGLLAGCNGNSNSSNSTATGDTASDSGEVTTLTWYMSINPVAADTDKVIEKLNEYSRDKIGVEIDYKVIANPDYKEKMPNLINAGEYFDICFTSNWTTDYLQFVGKDAFLDITDLLPQYAKETYDFIPQAMWNAVKVNGSIYGVPSYKEMGWQGGIVYNSDMAEAYGIDMSAVKTIEDYTAVLETVAEKSKAEGKDVIGVSGLTNAWPMAAPYESLTGNPLLPAAASVPQFNNFTDMAGQEVFNQYASEEFANYCKTAATCIKPFVDQYPYRKGEAFVADETYIKVRGIKTYVWLIMNAACRSIIGYQVSDNRGVGPCILAMRMAFQGLKKLPENFKFIADGYSAYPLAAMESTKKFGKDFTFQITQVIGLTNDDAVSKEHRPFKQIVERLNRTYKASYRKTNGFDNIEGANYDLALWVAYYNFLRPHKHNKYKVLNEVEMLQGADNMPGKWQLLIFLGQQTILQMQKSQAEE